MQEDLIKELDLAEQKAWDALSRYKFQMFGYWAAIWVHLNRIAKTKRPNPWAGVVKLAQLKRLRDQSLKEIVEHVSPVS